jgi:DNA (cytosine-5)-methyltransferase 1
MLHNTSRTVWRFARSPTIIAAVSRRREQRVPSEQLLKVVPEAPVAAPETFRIVEPREVMERQVRDANGRIHRSLLRRPQGVSKRRPTADNYDLWWLRSTKEPEHSWPKYNPVRVVDLFSGCGGLCVGIREACRAVNRKFEVEFANDVDVNALAVFKDNFKPSESSSEPIENLITEDFNDKTSSQERDTKKRIPKPLDFLIGGPPCQGHSDLNNYTRRDDPKNALYLLMARATELFEPRHVIIENVPGVRHDKNKIVAVTMDRLRNLGYKVAGEVIHGPDIGVPQTRRRYFLVATQVKNYDLVKAVAPFCLPGPRTLKWAIKDLENSVSSGTSIFDIPSKPTPQNQTRMNWFFRGDNTDSYNLPNSERPDCHRLKRHSYIGVYGRMRWDEPAPTITGGFGCSGQGRFVHPSPISGTTNGRTLTPHEAARVQFFPDFFKFDAAWNTNKRGRAALQQMVGNAVPSKFAYVLALSLLLADCT